MMELQQNQSSDATPAVPAPIPAAATTDKNQQISESDPESSGKKDSPAVVVEANSKETPEPSSEPNTESAPTVTTEATRTIPEPDFSVTLGTLKFLLEPVQKLVQVLFPTKRMKMLLTPPGTWMVDRDGYIILVFHENDEIDL